MSRSGIMVVVALGASIFFPCFATAQDFSYRSILEREYNPVTGDSMQIPGFALVPSERPFSTTSIIDGRIGQTDDPGDLSSDPVCEAPCPVAPCASWAFQAEAIWLKRNTPEQFPITFPGSNDPAILRTDDLKFDFAAGYRLTLARVCGDASWEATYFGVKTGTAEAQVVDPTRHLDSFLRVGIPNIANFRNAFAQRISEQTGLYSVEVNKRRFIGPDGPWFGSVLAGFRYLHIADKFEFLSNDTDPLISPTDIGLYTVRTQNNLVGAQVGGSLIRGLFDTFGIGAKLKAGLFANFAEQDSHLLNVQPNTSPSTDLFSHKARTHLASVIETGVFGTRQFTPNFGIRGGYDVFIISGVALTSQQLDFTANTFHTQPFVNSSSTLVLHGPNVGGWYSW